MNTKIKGMAAKRIAIVADDTKRTELIEWSYFNKDILVQQELTAISETAEILEGTLKVTVKKLFTRHTGGYDQLAGLIETHKIDILFFFAVPAVEKEKDNDLKKLLVLAAKENIMIACNEITTDLLMRTVLKKETDDTATRGYRGLIKQTISFINHLATKPSVAAM
jgi:methylglyoxal synthase